MAMYFMSVVDKKKKNRGGECDENYKRLLDRVSNKISNWHEDREKKQRGVFEFDEEYFDGEDSPNKFPSDESSCESSLSAE